MTTLTQDISESLPDFEEEWKRLAKEIRSSYEWKEMSIYSVVNKSPPAHQRTTIFRVLTSGESQDIPIGTSDLSKVEIKASVQKRFSDSKKMLPTLCLLLGNICSEGGEVNVSSILRKKKNLDNLNYIKIDVTDDYEFFMKQLNKTNIDFYLHLTVNGKFVVIRRYTISFTHKRDKRSGWSGFTEYKIPYEDLMPDYDQHKCCGGCWSGCVPVAWAQVFAYYDRVAHTHRFRYSTSHWRGGCGAYGDPSKKAPGSLNTQVEDYVEALRDPLRTRCRNGGGSTYNSDTNKVDGWFRQRQGSGRVITLSNINQQVSQYIKNGYPVVNNFWYNKKSKSGHSVVVTKIKEKSREYNSCRQVGWWWGKKTVCELKTQYEYEWYRRMGWGGYQNAWYPPAAFGAFVAVV